MVVYTGTVKKGCGQEISAGKTERPTTAWRQPPPGGKRAGIPSALHQWPPGLWFSRSLPCRWHEARASHDRRRRRIDRPGALLPGVGKMRQLAHVDEARSQADAARRRSEEHTSELQSHHD